MDVASRIVEVFGDRRGSGCLVAPHLILTAAHVLGAADRATVRFETSAEVFLCHVLWKSELRDLDAALLRIVAPHTTKDSPPADTSCELSPGEKAPLAGPGSGPVAAGLAAAIGRCPSLRWGRLVRTDEQACDVHGFPRVLKQANGLWDTGQFAVDVLPGTRRLGQRLALRVRGTPPGAAAGADSPWGGLSGGPVFHAGLLVGVVLSDPEHWQHGHIEALPVHLVTRDEGFAEAWEKGGRQRPYCEPAELAMLLDEGNRADAPRSAADLLRADSQVVSFRGRDADLARLRRWCKSKEPVSALLLHGKGGEGKTRLAIELAAEFRRAGWGCGLVPEHVPADRWKLLSGSEAEVLLIVDYAEARRAELDNLIRHLLPTPAKLRILLLARSEGDWWRTARARIPWFSSAGSERLAPLDEGRPLPERRAAYDEAVRNLVVQLAQLGYPGTDWPTVVGDLPVPPLEQSRYDSVLMTQMTALAALLAGASGEEASGDGQLTAEDVILAHEEHYWERTARHLGTAVSESARRQIAAATTLFQAAGETEGIALLRRVPALADASRQLLEDTMRWLGALYPSGTEPWGSLQPDRLGEYLIGQVAREGNAFLTAVFASASPGRSVQALHVLARATTHQHHLELTLASLLDAHPDQLGEAYIEVATEAESPGPLVAALHALLPGAPRQLLSRLHRAIPGDTRALASLARALAATLATESDRPAGEVLDLDAALAGQEILLTRVLGEELPGGSVPAEDLREVLAAAKASLARLREADNTQVAGRELRLGGMLVNVGMLHAKVGDHATAESHVGEAISVLAPLLAVGGETERRARSAIARARANLGVLLFEQRRPSEALPHLKAAVKLQRDPHHAPTVAERVGLARARARLANILDETGQPEQALNELGWAVHDFRELAELRADPYEAELGEVLYDLAMNMQRAQKPGLEFAREAAAINRKLSRSEPAYLNQLAQCLHSVTVFGIQNPGLASEVLPAAVEEVNLVRRHPWATADRLTSALHNLALLCGHAGRPAEAAAAARECAGLHLRATAEGSATPEAAQSLLTLGYYAMRAGTPQEALDSLTHAVQQGEALFTQDTLAHGDLLLSALRELAHAEAASGQRRQALATEARNVAVARELRNIAPESFQKQLVASLQWLAYRHRSLGHRHKEYATLQEAVTTAALVPTPQISQLFGLYSELKRTAEERGDDATALRVLDELLAALDRTDGVAGNDQDLGRTTAWALAERSRHHAEAGRWTESTADATQAAAVYRTLIGPTMTVADQAALAEVQLRLAVSARHIGHLDDAVAALASALDLAYDAGSDTAASSTLTELEFALQSAPARVVALWREATNRPLPLPPPRPTPEQKAKNPQPPTGSQTT